MNADWELMVLAAKAAGACRTDYSDRTPDHWIIQHADRVWREWRPLDDDGDALRLAVRCLPFYVLQYTSEDWEHCGKDGRAATRRAIVRAAAEIGRAMP